jgi:hypothetical protein
MVDTGRPLRDLRFSEIERNRKIDMQQHGRAEAKIEYAVIKAETFIKHADEHDSVGTHLRRYSEILELLRGANALLRDTGPLAWGKRRSCGTCGSPISKHGIDCLDCGENAGPAYREDDSA